MIATHRALAVALFRARAANWRVAVFMASLATGTAAGPARDWRLRSLYLDHLFTALTRRSGAN